MLTFETIRKIFEEERTGKGLSNLPENFFQEAREYIDRKEKIARKEGNEWEINTVKIRLRTIFERRERKIVEAALNYVHSGHEIENMIPEERKFFEEIVGAVRRFQEKRSHRFEEEEKNALVSILGNVERFVGMDTRNYGPFHEGDMATLPDQNAELLVKKGLAKKMEMNK